MGNLAQTLIHNGPVDEYHLVGLPDVLGYNTRVFADGTIPASLRLVDSKISTTGVFMGTDELAGEVVTGSFSRRIRARSPTRCSRVHPIWPSS